MKPRTHYVDQGKVVSLSGERDTWWRGSRWYSAERFGHFTVKGQLCPCCRGLQRKDQHCQTESFQCQESLFRNIAGVCQWTTGVCRLDLGQWSQTHMLCKSLRPPTWNTWSTMQFPRSSRVMTHPVSKKLVNKYSRRCTVTYTLVPRSRHRSRNTFFLFSCSPGFPFFFLSGKFLPCMSAWGQK